MSFHKRYITTDIIISFFNNSGSDGVINLYTKGVDVLILNEGLPSDINKIIHNDIWSSLPRASLEVEIYNKINSYLKQNNIKQ